MEPTTEKIIDDALAAILEVLKEHGVDHSQDRIDKLRGLLTVYSHLLTNEMAGRTTPKAANSGKKKPRA